jgi:dimethylargininase
MTLALVRRPSPNLADGLISHIERRPPDVALAQRQWDGYVQALAAVDWRIIEVPAAPLNPDSVFIEDTVVIYGSTAVITNPGAAERRGETPAVQRCVTDLGLRLGRIEAPATLDGGDVLKIDDRIYVGVGGRTTLAACEQLAALLPAEVIPVRVSKVLHLKSAVTALPDGTVIGYPPLVDDPDVFDRFLPVPEEAGSHVVVIDDETVLMAASAPQTRALLDQRGLNTIAVDISEFEKLEGCVTCLSVRLRDLT